MVGTDHDCCQIDANEALHAVVPGASFSGNTFPSTDGVFYGEDLLNATVPVAALDVFTHWDSVPTEVIAPTAVGSFSDFLGAPINLYSQVDVADDPGGGPKYSYISTSWQPGSGETEVTDPDPGGNTGVPDAGGTAVLLLTAFAALLPLRKK